MRSQITNVHLNEQMKLKTTMLLVEYPNAVSAKVISGKSLGEQKVNK